MKACWLWQLLQESAHTLNTACAQFCEVWTLVKYMHEKKQPCLSTSGHMHRRLSDTHCKFLLLENTIYKR